MSSRQLRRLQKLVAASSPESDSDEQDEFAPTFARSSGEGYIVHFNAFGALDKKNKKKAKKEQREAEAEAEAAAANVTPAETESEHDSEEEEYSEPSPPEDEETSEEMSYEEPPLPRKNKGKKKPSSNQSDNDEDSVERAVDDVNRILGQLDVKPATFAYPPPEVDVLQVDHKLLDARAELTRLLGEHPFTPNRRRGARASLMQRRIRVLDPRAIIPFRGLEMVKVEEIDGIKHFKFNHLPNYVGMLRNLTDLLRYTKWRSTLRNVPIGTVEGFLQMIDVLCEAGQYEYATKCVEAAVNFLQTIIAPAFSYVDGNTRLEYKYVENRPFHILLLKYMHLLSNKALHRTALEIAKLLVNLDPSDPLAIISVIDVIALRARRFDVILGLYDKWQWTRDAERLFNFVYSRALAQYHIAMKSKNDDDLSSANAWLREAIIAFPYVAVRILQLNRQNVSAFLDDDMYNLALTTPKALLELQNLHCEMAAPRWREPAGALAWLLETYKEIQREYADPDSTTFESVNVAAKQRDALFRRYPIQVQRHLAIIQPLGELLVDGKVPEVEKTIAFNPYPLDTSCTDFHRYYEATSERITQFETLMNNLFGNTNTGEAQFANIDFIQQL